MLGNKSIQKKYFELGKMVIRSEAKVKSNPASEASTKFFQPSFQKPMKRFEKKVPYARMVDWQA